MYIKCMHIRTCSCTNEAVRFIRFTMTTSGTPGYQSAPPRRIRLSPWTTEEELHLAGKEGMVSNSLK